ncbi:hypothetical protein [Ottowia sp.]|uniref:hypothetical protein n=1 Tax=Ottowia sp. TaxID=1898956 RepID=UPI0025E8078F|nr:hypothetical protein [Ottowia sp.]MBK6616599.1 hypothetical protein [Ottowia sp.]
MGWKSVKEHYRIGHSVQVTDAGICIGSAYIHNIMVVSKEGVLTKRYADRGNDDLARYQREMDADPELLRRLAGAEDKFSASITVYTYEGGSVVAKQCEEIGWPNVTHDGVMMYENAFSTDKEQAALWAAANARAGVRLYGRQIASAELELADLRKREQQARDDLRKLQLEFPVAVGTEAEDDGCAGQE